MVSIVVIHCRLRRPSFRFSTTQQHMKRVSVSSNAIHSFLVCSCCFFLVSYIIVLCLSFCTSLSLSLSLSPGGDALVNSGVMESLLQVLEWRAIQPMNITVSKCHHSNCRHRLDSTTCLICWNLQLLIVFVTIPPSPLDLQLVTRAVRVVDLITNLDMTAFHSLGGWDKMLERLKMEVEECKREVPDILPSFVKPAHPDSSSVPMETDAPPTTSSPACTAVESSDSEVKKPAGSDVIQCMPERSALIKSILNFLKKAIPDPTFAENIRNCKNRHT